MDCDNPACSEFQCIFRLYYLFFFCVCVLKNPFDVENGGQFELARSSSYQVFTGLMKRPTLFCRYTGLFKFGGVVGGGVCDVSNT